MTSTDRISLLKSILGSGEHTDFGIGVVSKNTVDAAISVSQTHNRPLMLIASRRQIECNQMGGGYVEKWTTEGFAKYVRGRDQKGLVLLCRDHGGPWQHPVEWNQNYNEARALESAKASFKVDIDSGFDLLHIDTGVSPSGEPPVDVGIERLIYLYRWCFNYAKSQGRTVAIEIGTEDQRDEAVNSVAFNELFGAIQTALVSNHLPLPLFVVAQTGTKVIEDRNIGGFNDPSLRQAISGNISTIVKSLRKNQVYLKAHNGDYLDDPCVEAFSSLGIGAINIAPEFGIQETKSLVQMLDEEGLVNQRNAFLNLAFNSGKWQKWKEVGHELSRYDCGILAGHYVFSTELARQIKSNLAKAKHTTDSEIDRRLAQGTANAINRLWNLAGPLFPAKVIAA